MWVRKRDVPGLKTENEGGAREVQFVKTKRRALEAIFNEVAGFDPEHVPVEFRGCSIAFAHTGGFEW